MKNLNKEFYNHLPNTLKKTGHMRKANSLCKIFHGEITIAINSKSFQITGRINFNWAGIHFGGYIKGNILGKQDHNEFIQCYLINPNIEIFINDGFFGKGFVNKMSINSDYFEVRLSGLLISGNKDNQVDRVLFSIPNLRPFHGAYNVVESASKKIKVQGNRIILENLGYKITLDKRFNSDTMYTSLQESGGYGFMYSGELIKEGDLMTFSEISEMLRCLSRFLSFINGRKVSALFIEGHMGQNLVWKDYTGYTNEPYKSVHHCIPQIWTKHHSAMWAVFSDHFFDQKHKTIISSVVYWYIEANGNNGIEVRSVLAQSALELLFNWFNEKKMIKEENEGSNFSASDKLRAILDIINYPKKVPISLKELSDYLDSHHVENEFSKKTGKEYYPEKDACLIITKIRNALVHSDNRNRRKLAKIPDKALAQSVNLSLVYIEMAILYILGYNGKFKNRCSPTDWDGQESLVPWARMN